MSEEFIWKKKIELVLTIETISNTPQIYLFIFGFKKKIFSLLVNNPNLLLVIAN